MSDNRPGNPPQKLLTYSSTHPYETLHVPVGESGRTWVVFHGIGFLSKYFLRYFAHLDPVTNYIIAPQAPSLYYLDPDYRNVGASWLTRVDTERNMDNLLNYLDALYRTESLEKASNLVLMGYSQGVSVLCRWLSRREVTCSRLILYAGRVPSELGPRDFAHLPETTPVEVYVGEQDPFLPAAERAGLEDQVSELFGPRLRLIVYKGGHELKKEWIQ